MTKFEWRMTNQKAAVMLRLPQFSIAHLLVFTFVVALDVWGFTQGAWTGFCITLVSQIVFWTVMRVFTEIRLQPALKTEMPTWRLDKAVFVSALCSVAAAFSFLFTVLV